MITYTIHVRTLETGKYTQPKTELYWSRSWIGLWIIPVYSFYSFQIVPDTLMQTSSNTDRLMDKLHYYMYNMYNNTTLHMLLWTGKFTDTYTCVHVTVILLQQSDI